MVDDSDFELLDEGMEDVVLKTQLTESRHILRNKLGSRALKVRVWGG